MPVLQLPNGLGETAGIDALAASKPLQMSGRVWWVNSATGVDAGGTAGQDREKPLATIGQAHTNASADDIIVLQQGHTETRTSQLGITKNLTIVGIGTTNGKPSATLKMNSAASILLSCGATVELRNIYFPENLQTNASTKVALTDNCRVIGCYFEQGAKDTGAGVSALDSSYVKVLGTTFISTATVVATRPLTGLQLGGVGIGTVGIDLDGLILSDGTVGFSSAACSLSGGVAPTQMRGIGLNLLLGASMNIPGATGWLNIGTVTGGGRVIQ